MINKAYHQLHTHLPGSLRRPLIGITGNFGDKGCELAEGYFESVVRAGATPIVLPPLSDHEALVPLVDRLDGLILSGGADLNPLFVGEEPSPLLGSINGHRDASELLLVRLAFDRQLPMLGICRGCQMLAAALGGSIWQDLSLSTDCPTRVKHSQQLDRSYPSHTVRLEEGTLLQSLFNTDELAVNSFHHQAVRTTGPHLRVSAYAKDGIIEAIESTEHKSILGVQWHPEAFCLRGDTSMQPLFQWLTDEAANYAEARRLHARLLTLDSHCDTPMFFNQDIRFGQRDDRILVDLHKMNEGGLDASIMVAYIPQGERTPEGYAAASAYAEKQLQRVRQMVNDLSAQGAALALARTPEELYQLKREGKRAIMTGIENGYAIGKDISLVEHFARQGIVYITLCHNGNNDICGSARPREGEPLEGLSPFGAQVISEMNRLGLLVDLSHASVPTFFDVLETSRQPVVCSHSSARALCDHPRNLTDEQLRALAAKDGVAQVTFYSGFLRADGQATVIDAVDHLCHMIDVAGIEHVGIGTDFDGDGGVPGLASASELINFTRHLLRRRFSEDDLRLIWGGNFLRTMSQVQAMGKNERISGAGG